MKARNTDRKNEKGAALVMALLMAALLLTGCIALLTGASLLTANVTDSVAEQQAYNAAESGVQTAINVLRRNAAPSPLLNPTKSVSHTSNKIDFARAVNLETSNKPTDPATFARLSRWINYDSTAPNARASIGKPEDNTAFSVTVRDPDNPDAIIALTTSANIGSGGDTATFGTVLNGATITYKSTSTGNVNITGREATIGLGSFTIAKQNVFPLSTDNTTIPDTPFTITVKMTAPVPALIKLRGTIKAGSISSSSAGSVQIVFDSPAYNLLGSIITLPGNITPNAPNVNGGKTDLNVTVTLSQPRRLVIRSDGYGPRGAHKVFEAIVMRDNFDGIIPATITLVGAASGSIFKSSTTSSLQSVTYSGSDVLSNAINPSVATVSNGSGGLLSGLISNLSGSPLCVGCQIISKTADISPEETPDYLKSAANLDQLISRYRETAKAAGRYYTNENPPPDFGNSFGTGITFIDGDSTLGSSAGTPISGGGILIVTGKLTLGNAFNFNGNILVTGKDGVKKINNGGSSTLRGNLVVAPYQIGDTAAGFLPPKYDITGGTASTLIYTASNLLFGSDNYNTVVVSVGEK